MDFNAITVSTHGMKVQVIYGDLIIAQPEKKKYGSFCRDPNVRTY